MNSDDIMLGGADVSLQEIMVLRVTYYITSYFCFIQIVGLWRV